MHRSAFMQKCQKLAGPRSRKMPKTRRSAITEICRKTSKFAAKKKCTGQHLCKNPKNSQVRGDGKRQKLAGPRPRKNAKNLQVRGHGNMPKNFQVRSHKKIKKVHRSAFMWKSEKLASLQSRKMPKNSQVRVYKKIPKTRGSAVTENGKNSQVRLYEKCQKPARPRSQKYAKKLPNSRSQKNLKIHRSAFMHKS